MMAYLKASMKEMPMALELVMLKDQERENCLDYCSMMELKMAYDWAAVTWMD